METTPGIDYGAVLADLKRRRDELDKAIVVLEGIIGGGALPPLLIAAGDSVDVTDAVPGVRLSKVGPPPSLRDDAFFGMSIAQAAQKYLDIRKNPAGVQEITIALEKGGLTHRSENFYKTVNAVMNRNAEGASSTFAKVKRGVFGLRAWYPNFRPKDGDKEEG